MIKNIFKNETFESRSEAFFKAKNFLNNCLHENFIQNITFNSQNNPLISAVIPLYDSEQFIGKTVKSIQNQNIKDIEIILVNDFSKDNTLSVIKKLEEVDKRIKIINNKKNQGILYSRSIGVLLSIGKYIFPLDNDDMFLNEDVFKIISDIALESDIDIVEFKGIFQLYKVGNILNETTINDTSFQDHKPNLVLFQPELGKFPLKEGNATVEMFNDVYLWAKCIKSELYKKAITKLGFSRISRHVLIFEDIYIIYVLFNIAHSYKFITKYGLFRIKREKSASNIWGDFHEMNKSILYLLEIVIEFSKDIIENKKIIVFLVIHLLFRKKLKETLSISEKYKELIFSCLNKILCSNYFSSKDKKKIKQIASRKLAFFNYFFHRRVCSYPYLFK